MAEVTPEGKSAPAVPVGDALVRGFLKTAVLTALKQHGAIADPVHFFRSIFVRGETQAELAEFANPISRHLALVSVLKSLASRRLVAFDHQGDFPVHELTEEGQRVLAEGSPEHQLLAAIPAEGATMDQLKTALGAALFGLALGLCKKKKLVRSEGPKFFRADPAATGDATRSDLEAVAAGRVDALPVGALQELAARRLVAKTAVKFYWVRAGPDFAGFGAVLEKQPLEELTHLELAKARLRAIVRTALADAAAGQIDNSFELVLARTAGWGAGDALEQGLLADFLLECNAVLRALVAADAVQVVAGAGAGAAPTIVAGAAFEAAVQQQLLVTSRTDLTLEVQKLLAARGTDAAGLNWAPYNLAAEPRLTSTSGLGALHPITKVRAEFHNILVSMGFQEMPTNQFVESSFWNFDSLFQPQQHPAREAHDTFFLSAPTTSDLDRALEPGYLPRVKAAHETGAGCASHGYRYTWARGEAEKNVLRTHTTATSSRMLFALAEEYRRTGVFTPRKYFSIDRVFRNETADATHLSEFHQVEGLVADYDLNLGHLFHTIKTFYEKIGVDNVVFKPAYNPYTEPSMEIFTYSRELDRNLEIGNSGMFRPEMLLPMGLPPGVRVIAWGLGLERPTMAKFQMKTIRDLVGPDMDIKLIRDNPIVRYP